MFSRLGVEVGAGSRLSRWNAVTATVLTVIALTLTSTVSQAATVTPEPSVEPSIEPTPGEVDPTVPEAVEPPAAGDDSEQPPSDGGLSEALEGFGEVTTEDVPVVASADDRGPPIEDAETHTGAPAVVIPLQAVRETLVVDGEGGQDLVQGLTSVSLSEVLESAFAESDVTVPQDTALRGDLIGEQFPRASAGDQVEVETIPLAGEIPGAAFALRLTATDPNADAQWMGVDLDISRVRDSQGGDFAGRLQLMVFPECILTSPDDPSCTVGVPLDDANIDGNTLSGVVPADAGNGIRLEGARGYGGMRSTAVRATDLLTDVAGLRGFPMATTSQGTIVAAVSGAAGPGGTFAKTDLAPAGSWAVAEQSGAFTYQVPLEVPPVAAGPVPDLALSYNSQILDGHTPASNGQSSWIADGWDMQFGYIERIYNSCTAEGVGGSAITLATAFPASTKVYSPGDFNKDGENDVLALNAAGEFWLHFGDGAGGLDADGIKVGTSWGGFKSILTPGDFDGDTFVDVIAWSTNGDLRLYRGNGVNGFIIPGGTVIGTGWNMYVEVIAPGDFSGDGNPDVIGRDSAGRLWFYGGNGAGGWTTYRPQVGSGFQIYSKIITPGDFTGDGFVDIIGIYPNGTPELFKGNGNHGWLSGSGFAVPGPWASASAFIGSPDLNGDGLEDLIGRGPAGEVLVWPGNGKGGGIASKGNDLCWSRAFDPVTYTVNGQSVALSAAEQAAYVMSLGGATYELFPQGNNVFKTSPDSGIVVERKNRGAGTNGDDAGEYFRVWTPDGGVAYFGYGHNGTTPTSSVATVQQWANEGGPQCVGACQQGYRWMLDIQVDSAKNAMVYTYSQETNRYAQSGSTVYNTYTSAIYPSKIEYGGRFTGASWDAPAVTSTTARVEFILTGRCVENTIADYSRSPADGGVIAGCLPPKEAPASFPDVPADLICTTAAACNTTTQRTPAFFKQKRLARVDTYVLADTTWTKVAAHTLYSTYPLPAAASGRTLWLDGVFTRYVGQEPLQNPAADDLITYAIAFDGALMPNRVDWTSEPGKLEKRRVTGIRNEMGGYVKVNYQREFLSTAVGGQCPMNGRTTATPKDGLSSTWYRENTWECFRAKGADGNYGLYHRYLVTSIDLVDDVADQPTQTFRYTYTPGSTTQPLWSYADSINDSRNASYVDKQEFSTFLGYPKVTVTTGEDDTESSTITYFHSGRLGTWDGQPGTVNTGITSAKVDLPSGFTDPNDHGALRGMPALVEVRDASFRILQATQYGYNVVVRADGPYQHDATVVQTVSVTSTRTAHNDGFAESRKSKVTNTYADSTRPWIVTQTVSVPLSSASNLNATRSTTQYTFNSVDYAGFSDWNPSSPAPFFHLPISGSSYYKLNSTIGEHLTGQWETSYLESGGVMRGLPVSERQRVTEGAGAEAWLQSSATYDVMGRILTAKGPAETLNGTQVSWNYGGDPERMEQRHVRVTNQAGWVTKQWIDPAFGNVVRTQDANGDYTHYKYDVGGLLVAAWAPKENLRETDNNAADAPDGSKAPTVFYAYDVYASALSIRRTPVAVVSAQFVGRNSSGSWVTLPEASTVRRSYEFLDGFGRVVESHTVAPDGTGGRLVSQVALDDVGRVVRASEPFYDALPAQVASGLKKGLWPTVPRYTETTYDQSGRVDTTTMKVLVNGVQTSVPLSNADYGLDWSLSTALTTGASTRVETDSLGRTVTQIQNPATGGGGLPIATTYAYGITAAGSTVTVTDAAQKATVFTSDLGGRRIGLTDPNSGTSTYTYNAKGQVAQIVSEAGTVNLTYDELGRMKKRTTVDAEDEESSSAEWFYDPLGHLGALDHEVASTMTPVSTEPFVVTKTFTYNPLHQLTGTTVTLPSTSLLGDLSGDSYATTVGYDATGAATQLTHQAIGGLPLETVTTDLDLLGRARSLEVAVTGQPTKTVVEGTQFDALGRQLSRTYGNGVERAYTWNQKWGSLYILTASYDAGAEVVQSEKFLRDTSGRVTSVADGVEGITQCYAYDGHNRLDTAWTDTRTISTCGDGPGAATQPVSAQEDLGYAVDYQYKPTGQIESITDVLDSLSPVVSQYHYDDASSPNAVTSVTEGALTDTFAYDAAGRMVTRAVDSTSTLLTWDASSNLVATSGQGGDFVYVYDASGQRVAQAKVSELTTSANPVSATVYLGATQVTDSETATEGPVDATRFYAFGGATVATATSTAGAAPVWSLMLGDIQGSAQVMMDLVPDAGAATGFEPASSSHTVTRDAYLPYGAERGDSDLTIDRGWLGQVEDTDTGLTYLNARYYDPLLGRFLSPDPLMNPGDPRTLDPYRYADNNPIVYSDPTGLCPGRAAYGEGDTACTSYVSLSRNYITGEFIEPNMESGLYGQTDRVTMAVVSSMTFAPMMSMIQTGAALRDPMATAEGLWYGITHPTEFARAYREQYRANQEMCNGCGDGMVMFDAATLVYAGTKLAPVARTASASAVAAVANARVGIAAIKVQRVTNDAAKKFDAGVFTYTFRQNLAREQNSSLSAMFRGYQIDAYVKRQLANSSMVTQVVRITRPGQKGPDFIVLRGRGTPNGIRWFDITTTRQWKAHTDKYTPYYGSGKQIKLN